MEQQHLPYSGNVFAAAAEIERETGEPVILSIGYEKRKTSDFLAELKEAGVEIVVDVRQSAFSMRPDFRKRKLTELLQAAGISYEHLAAAGNPFRKEAGNTEQCLKLYSTFLRNSPDVMEDIAARLKSLAVKHRRFAVLCYERNACDCHRTILLHQLRAAHRLRFSLLEV